MITVIAFGLCFVLFASLAESFEYKERYIITEAKERKWYSYYWHNFQLFERVDAILFGYFLCKLPFADAVKILFLAASVFWIAYDGAINLARKQNIFYISGQSEAVTDNLAKWYIKIGLLVIALIINFV